VPRRSRCGHSKARNQFTETFGFAGEIDEVAATSFSRGGGTAVASQRETFGTKVKAADGPERLAPATRGETVADGDESATGRRTRLPPQVKKISQPQRGEHMDRPDEPPPRESRAAHRSTDLGTCAQGRDRRPPAGRGGLAAIRIGHGMMVRFRKLTDSDAHAQSAAAARHYVNADTAAPAGPTTSSPCEFGEERGHGDDETGPRR